MLTSEDIPVSAETVLLESSDMAFLVDTVVDGGYGGGSDGVSLTVDGLDGPVSLFCVPASALIVPFGEQAPAVYAAAAYNIAAEHANAGHGGHGGGGVAYEDSSPPPSSPPSLRQSQSVKNDFANLEGCILNMRISVQRLTNFCKESLQRFKDPY